MSKEQTKVLKEQPWTKEQTKEQYVWTKFKVARLSKV